MFKKILKWTGIVLGGLIAVLLIANAVFVWRSSVALERRLQAIRDAGEPTSIADLARKPIPPEDDAATYLERAKQDFVAIEKALAALSERESYQRGQLDSAEITTLKDVLDAHAGAVRLAEQAAACPDYNPQLDYSLSASEFTAAWIEQATPIRSAVRLLDQRTTVLLALGRCDEAAGCATAMLRLARHADQEPVLVGYLVAIACRRIAYQAANRVLRSGPLSDSVRQALDDELARHDLWASLAQTLKSERAYGYSARQEMNLGRFWPARGFWNTALGYFLDVMTEQVSLVQSPAAEIGHPTVPRPSSPWTTLTDLLMPSIQATAHTTRQTIAMQRCLRMLNAVTRLEQGGVPVTGLADLSLPPAETVDPFSGQPLLIKKLGEHWVIYSVGADLNDDGGQLAADGQPVRGTDLGLGPVPALPALGKSSAAEEPRTPSYGLAASGLGWQGAARSTTGSFGYWSNGSNGRGIVSPRSVSPT